MKARACGPGPSCGGRPFRGSGPFLELAVPLSLPMRHFILSAAAFLAFAAAFAFRTERFVGFGFDARFALGGVHLLTLGWITSAIFGALSQMPPSLWSVPLASQRAVRAAFAALALGLAGFVAALWTGREAYWLPAALLAASVFLYLANLAATMWRAPKLGWTGLHLAASAVFMGAAAVVGGLLAWDRQRGLLFSSPEGALVAHVHLALVGWVSLTIAGVSYRLVPALASFSGGPASEARAAFGLAVAGTSLLAADRLFGGSRLGAAPAWILAAAYVGYLAQFRRLAVIRPKPLDPSTCFTFGGALGGLAWASLGVGLATGLVEDGLESRSAYVFLALVGWATPWILAQVHKIVPFLVWLHVYSPREWRPPIEIPKLEDLTSRRLAWLEFAAWASGAPLAAWGLFNGSLPSARAGGALLFACAAAYVWNTAATVRHALRPDRRWTLPGAGLVRMRE